MEKNELTTREQLKTYFETGKHPTESQFAELIDSLRFKEDVLTNKEVAILANSLASIDNGYVMYNVSGNEDLNFQIVVNQEDSEDQVITFRNTVGESKKQYFFGNAPYIVKAKEFPIKTLEKNEYYIMSWQLNPDYWMNRIFGNNLPTIPQGFEFGAMETKKIVLQIGKVNLGREINIVNTNIKFINKTEAPIQYRVSGGSWADVYREDDIVTNHYDIWDYLSIEYNADLRGINRSIECKFYNTDTDRLISTNYFLAETYYKYIGGGSQERGRNLRIECDYATMDK